MNNFTGCIDVTRSVEQPNGVALHVYDSTLLYRIEHQGKRPIVHLTEEFLDGNDKYPQYLSLQSRAKTFIAVTDNQDKTTIVSWNDVCPHIHGDDMAAAGFFRCLTGPIDGVRCFSCGIIMYNWSLDDNSLWKHVNHAPMCKFAFRALLRSQVIHPPCQGSGGNVRALSSSAMLSFFSYSSDVIYSAQKQNFENEQEEYQCEQKRLMSFSRHIANIPDPRSMASSGFYYVGPRDETRCFACRFTFFKWSNNDRPMLEHAKLSPYCPFIRGLVCGSVSMSASEGQSEEVADIPSSDIKVPEFANRQKRIRSFGIWWMAQMMADAGFFYTGSNDRVRCYACGGTLSKLYDDYIAQSPKELHAIWFPRCKLSIKK